MFNLMKLDWRKSSSYRKTTLILLLIHLAFSLSGIVIQSFRFIGIIILGLTFAVFVLTTIGSLLFLKDDFDHKNPINLVLPFSGKEVIISKISVFLANLAFIGLASIVCLLIYLTLAGFVKIAIDMDVLEAIQNIIRNWVLDYQLAIPSIISKVIGVLTYALIAIFSILFVRSKQAKTGTIKWLLLAFILVLLFIFLLEILNEKLAFYLNLETLKFGNLNEELDDMSTIAISTRTVILPAFSQEMCFFVQDFAGASENMPVFMPLPTLALIAIDLILFKASVNLIDKKIDF